MVCVGQERVPPRRPTQRREYPKPICSICPVTYCSLSLWVRKLEIQAILYFFFLSLTPSCQTFQIRSAFWCSKSLFDYKYSMDQSKSLWPVVLIFICKMWRITLTLPGVLGRWIHSSKWFHIWKHNAYAAWKKAGCHKAQTPFNTRPSVCFQAGIKPD